MHAGVPGSSPALPLEFLRAGLYPPSGVVLYCWVGLSWVPIVGAADPILRVETAFREVMRLPSSSHSFDPSHTISCMIDHSPSATRPWAVYVSHMIHTSSESICDAV